MNKADPYLRIPAMQVADIRLPEEVDGLYDLAYNLWWSWNHQALRMFGSIDSRSWHLYRNPVQLLVNMDRQQWESLLASDAFMEHYEAVSHRLESYMDPSRETWFRRRFPDFEGGPVAYFSMEFGLHTSLPIYSGGLGVLSGDHCKAASDLGLPFVAVGLLYRYGYFRQAIDADGFQQHIYPEYDFKRLPLRPALDDSGREIVVRVPIGDGEVAAKVWLVQVGRISLLLLDTDVHENHVADRSITRVLYVRGRETRLLQEMVLGIGGVKALRAVGIKPSVWHINEGHSSLLQLERFRQEIADGGGDLSSVIDSTRRSTVFTTHTPVSAGNEQFDRGLARGYLAPWAERLGTDVERLLDFGAADHGEPGQALNLSAFALRTSSYANGVSMLNGEVADRMWRHLFPEKPNDEPVVDAITNGVHAQTWLGPEMKSLMGRLLGRRWWDELHETEGWEQVRSLDRRELWKIHNVQKEALMRFVRSRLREQHARHGRPPADLRTIDDLVKGEALTIGFARRFATYKRAGLLVTDLHRLRQMLTNRERPVRIIIAGKAHPADRPAQDLIRHLFKLSQEEELKGHIIFLENYDMRVAQKLVRGVDVWLNNPRRPLEASGTSGQKAAMNGVLNCSILDGWWPEAYNPKLGWAIGSDFEGGDNWREDEHDALSLYRLLEEEIVPTFYERDEDGFPERWVEMMLESIVNVGAGFSASRMVIDYIEHAYSPRFPERS